MTHLTPEEFGAAFGFGKSAFRLELFDRYVSENETEPMRRFLAGQHVDPAWRKPWAGLVREETAAGKRMARVHVVTEPLSNYLRFELTCGYPASVEAGEDVRILSRNDHPGLDLPSRDFWMFDDSRVAEMDYDENGNFLGGDVTEDPGTIARCRQARDTAMKLSVPLADYLASFSMKEAV